MAARKTKLLIYTNGVVTDILYSPVLFITVEQLAIFLQENGYQFTNAELQVILNSQLDTEVECCEELTPITPEFIITFPTTTSAILEIVNYTTQEDKNNYFLEVLLDGLVVQTLIIVDSITSITDLDQGTLYTFRVVSQTCSNNVKVEVELQTPPILLTVTVIGQGTSPQAVNGSQVHSLISGDDFYIEFNGGVFNTDELWYYKSITKDGGNIENLVTFTETINNVNTDGNLTLINLTQDTEVIITFTTRTAQWCIDTSCIVCDELLEQATLNILYVYENGQQVTGSPFTITTGADPQVIAETYFISTELATELIANQIIPSLGVCCFDDIPVISNLITTLVTDSQIDYSFDCVPSLTQYTAQIRRLPVNQLIQQSILTTDTGSFIDLQEGVDYEISINASNCSGGDIETVTATTLISCLEIAPVLNPLIVSNLPAGTLSVAYSTVGVYNEQYNIQLYHPKNGLIEQVLTSDLSYQFTQITGAVEYTIVVVVSNCAGSDSLSTTGTVLFPCDELPVGQLINPIFATSIEDGLITINTLETNTGFVLPTALNIIFETLPLSTPSSLVSAIINPMDLPMTFGVGGDIDFNGTLQGRGFAGLDIRVVFSYSSCDGGQTIFTNDVTVVNDPVFINAEFTGNEFGNLQINNNGVITNLIVDDLVSIASSRGANVILKWGIVNLSTGLLNSAAIDVNYLQYKLPARIVSTTIDSIITPGNPIITIPDENNVVQAREYSFIMPNSDVTVNTIFKDLPVYDVDFENPACYVLDIDNRVIEVKDRFNLISDTVTLDQAVGTIYAGKLGLVSTESHGYELVITNRNNTLFAVARSSEESTYGVNELVGNPLVEVRRGASVAATDYAKIISIIPNVNTDTPYVFSYTTHLFSLRDTNIPELFAVGTNYTFSGAVSTSFNSIRFNSKDAATKFYSRVLTADYVTAQEYELFKSKLKTKYSI